MISQKEAQLLLDESLMKKYRGPNRGFVSLPWMWYNVPESRDAIRSFFYRNVVITVHPGYSIYLRTALTGKSRPDIEREHGSYSEYFERLKAFVHYADDASELIVLYYSKKFLKETFRLIGELNNIVLVPTRETNASISETAMGCSEENYYAFLKEVVKWGRACGEWYGGHGCVSHVMDNMKGMNIDLLKELTYPTRGEYKGEPDEQRMEGGFEYLVDRKIIESDDGKTFDLSDSGKELLAECAVKTFAECPKARKSVKFAKHRTLTLMCMHDQENSQHSTSGTLDLRAIPALDKFVGDKLFGEIYQMAQNVRKKTSPLETSQQVK